MTIIRSQSILSAHMDHINEAPVINKPYPPRMTKLDQNHDTVIMPRDTMTFPTIRKTKEPRMFDKAIEEDGYKQIVDSLSPQEIVNMSDPNLPLRHFRADKGDIEKAIKRTKYAIQWRKQSRVEEILKAAHNPTTPQEEEIRKILMKEAETGKMFVRNYDKEGRAILWIYQKRENTNNPENNIMHLVYQIERMIACTERQGYEKSVIVFDFLGWKMKHASSLDVTKKTIHILQDCYVERIARIYITNSPAVFRTFFNMVKVFLDSNTRKKIVFVTEKERPEMEKYFDPETAESCIFGASKVNDYNVQEYFSTPLNVSFDETS